MTVARARLSLLHTEENLLDEACALCRKPLCQISWAQGNGGCGGGVMGLGTAPLQKRVPEVTVPGRRAA